MKNILINLFVILLLGKSTTGFSTSKSKLVYQKNLLKLTPKSNIIQPDQLQKLNNYIEEESINDLYQDITQQKINTIYITNDLKNIYAEKNSNQVELNNQKNNKEKNTNSITFSKPSSIFQYVKQVHSEPSITQKIIDQTFEKNIDSYILQPVSNPISNFLAGTVSFFDTFLFPFFIISFIISFLGNIINNGGLNTGNNLNKASSIFSGNNYKKNMDSVRQSLKESNMTLASWAGSPEIFEECTEVVSYLKNSSKYSLIGAEIPKGILLDGPPGTGKTLLAKAIASECDANFISIASSEFVEIFVGLGAQKVRNLFSQAREAKPCIIFIDEIDSIGKQRGTGINMGNDEREQTLNQLLAEMDGFQQNEGLLIIGATNRKDVLDNALLRPGRFDRIITVPLPDKESRKKILKVHSKDRKIDTQVNYDFLAEITSGFSGAQLKNLINEAAIYCVREGNNAVNQSHIEKALEKIIVGIVKKDDTRSAEIKRRVAIHEIGHSFLVKVFDQYFDLKKVTIQSTYNGAGGYTLFNEKPELIEGGLYTKDILKKRLIIAMGGKACEELYFENNFVSLGAIQDLKQANELAKNMVGNYGMGNDLQVFYNEDIESSRNPFLGRSLASGMSYSDKTKELFDKEVLDLVKGAYKEAYMLLKNNKEIVNELVNELLQKKTIYNSHFNELNIFIPNDHYLISEKYPENIIFHDKNFNI